MTRVTRGWHRGDLAAPGPIALVVAMVLCVLYLLTANTGLAQVNDTRAAMLGSWTLGTQAALALPEGWPPSANYWGVETEGGHVYVNRFPGTAYWAAPLYAVHGAFTGTEVPAHPFLVDPAPAAWAAAVTAATAVAVMFLLLQRELSVGLEPPPARRGGRAGRSPGVRATGAHVAPRGFWTSPWPALVGALGLGLATSVWSVAADALWPHGPTLLGLSLALLGWRVGQPVLCGIGALVTVVARPHTVVATLVLALAAWRDDRRAGAVGLVVGSLAGLAVVAGYSLAVFGTPLPVAGYDVPGHLGGLASHSPWQTVRALGLALLSPQRGVLVFSPVIGGLIAAAVWRRRTVPGWTWWAALAGVCYLVVQVRAVGHAGGADFFAYRISLEPVLLSTPLLVAGGLRAARRSAAAAWVLGLLLAVSVAVHAYGAVARSVTPHLEREWEQIERQVRAEFGDGEVRIEDL